MELTPRRQRNFEGHLEANEERTGAPRRTLRLPAKTVMARGTTVVSGTFRANRAAGSRSTPIARRVDKSTEKPDAYWFTNRLVYCLSQPQRTRGNHMQR
jgi:hypothetical protein